MDKVFVGRNPCIKPRRGAGNSAGWLEPCEWCEKTNWRSESKKDHAAYRCKTKDCGSSKSVLSQDLDLFNKKLALRSLIGALWLFFSPLNVSPDQAGLVLGVDHRTVRDLLVNFRQWLTPLWKFELNTRQPDAAEPRSLRPVETVQALHVEALHKL